MMKRMNERKRSLIQIIDLLRVKGEMSQSEICRQIQLQPSTLSYLINDLKRMGLVVNSGLAPSQIGPGKPATMISLNQSHTKFLGLYAKDDQLVLYVVGLDGALARRAVYTIPSPDLLEESMIGAIGSMLKEFTDIEGIGIAIKGVVLTADAIEFGQREHLGYRRWQIQGLTAHLRSQFPVPVILENDANCMALLYQYGQQRSRLNLLLYLLNQSPFGIGCAILDQGKLLRGGRGAAGQYFEKGSPFVHENGTGPRVTDSPRFVHLLMQHILSAAYLLDPDEIVLTGSLFDQAGDQDALAQELGRQRFPMPVTIRAEDTRYNPAMGAALIATTQFISDTIIKVGAR